MKSTRVAPLACVVVILLSLLTRLIAAQTPDLAGHWKFDHTQDDSTGNNETGHVVGNAAWARGAKGQAFRFNGKTTLRFDRSSALSIVEDISIELWVNPHQIGHGESTYLLSKWTSPQDANYVLRLFREGSLASQSAGLSFWANAGGKWQPVSAEYPVSKLDVWHHVAWTYNTVSGGQLYVNGEPYGSSIGSGLLRTNSAHLQMGTAATGPTFDGSLDEVRIYNRILSASEIRQDYLNLKLGGAWHFERNTLDDSGNGNDGKVTGHVQWDIGEQGVGFRFDGKTRLDFGGAPSLSARDNISTALWLNPQSWPLRSPIYPLRKGSRRDHADYALRLEPDHGISFWATTRGVWQAVSPRYELPALNRWYHLAWKYNSSAGGALYVNGIKQGGLVGHGRLVSSSSPLQAGEQEQEHETGFQGLLDELSVHGRLLDDAEILKMSRRVEDVGCILETDTMRLDVDKTGRITSLIDRSTRKDYAASNGYFAKLSKANVQFIPSSCVQHEGGLLLDFATANVTIDIATRVQKSYVVLQVRSMRGDMSSVESVQLLAIAPTLNGTRNHMSGMQGDDAFTLVLRAMNTKGTVGSPFPALALKRQGGIESAKFALLAVPTPQLRAGLQTMFRQEGVAQSAWGGPSALDAVETKQSYVFMDFGLLGRASKTSIVDSFVNDHIRLAKQAGAQFLNFYGWWPNDMQFGHYPLDNTKFPNGLQTMKRYVDAAHDAGLKASLHSLVGCISTSDASVTPKPNAGLARDSEFALRTRLDARGTGTINHQTGAGSGASDTGEYYQIDDELLLCPGVNTDNLLGGCTRGALGTKQARHMPGARVARLSSRPCFFPSPDSALLNNVADNLANIVDVANFDMIYMDGLDLVPDWRSRAQLGEAVFNAIKKRPIRVEASQWNHHIWPFYSNLGALDFPQYGAKRFVDFHTKMIEHFTRDSLLPTELGWWQILGATREHYSQLPDEIELLFVRMLGTDSAVSLEGPFGINHRQDEYLATLKKYEAIRLSGGLRPSTKAQLRMPNKEFHLTPTGSFIEREYPSHKFELDQGNAVWGDSKLVAYWNLNETYADISGNGNNGTMSGKAVWVTGKKGRGLAFDGNSHISFGADPSLSIQDDISIEFWFYPTEWPAVDQVPIVQKHTADSDANYVVSFFGRNAGPTRDRTLGVMGNALGKWGFISSLYRVHELNCWYHVVWTYNSNQGGKLYVNSNAVGVPVGSGALTTNHAALVVGGLGTDRQFKGSLDEVKVYHRILSPMEIHEKYVELRKASTWTLLNRFGTQSAKFRIQALHAARPYGSGGIPISDSSCDLGLMRESAPHVASRFEVAPNAACTYTATNSGETRVGAWSVVSKKFFPVLSIEANAPDSTDYGAIGVWIRGDGKSEVLNFQLSHQSPWVVLDDHHVEVNFTGWKYFELFLRERDAAKYWDYTWPSGVGVSHRMGLDRRHLEKLSVYYNNLPPLGDVNCQLSPIVVLPVDSTRLVNPSVTVNTQKVTFPISLESGQYLEFYDPSNSRLYDINGRLIGSVTPVGVVPQVLSGDNDVEFTAEGTSGYNTRANLTMIIDGPLVN